MNSEENSQKSQKQLRQETLLILLKSAFLIRKERAKKTEYYTLVSHNES